MGIKDWSLKKEVMRVAMDLHRVNDIPEYVIDEETCQKNKFTMEGLLDHWSNRWGKETYTFSERSKYWKYFELLAGVLRCKGDYPARMLVFGTINEFIDSLPEDTCQDLNTAANEPHGFQSELADELRDVLSKVGKKYKSKRVNRKPQQIVEGQSSANEPFPIWTKDGDGALRRLDIGMQARFIDQSLYYQRPESVDLWFAVTNNQWYSGFDECKAGLEHLFLTDLWRGFVTSQEFGGIVMLAGGGSPSKDFKIIRNLTGLRKCSGQQASVRYTLLDTSHYMLRASRSELLGQLLKRGIASGVELNIVEWDMMLLSDVHDLVRSGRGNVIWFLTGGTLGNVDEGAFFLSVAKDSIEGDLLIVGVGCVNDNVTETVMSMLESEYEQNEVKDLVKVPLEAVWSNLDKEGTVTEAMKKIEVKVSKEADKEDSLVPGAVSVVAKISVEDFGEVKLFKSNRYTESGLIEFAFKYGWEHITSVSGQTDSFKQIVFRYDGKKRKTVD